MPLLAKTTKNPIQPKVYLIGKEKITGIVVLDDFKYSLSNPIEAVDVCFKLFWALNLKYPLECKAVWYLIQKLIYGISSEFDVQNASVETLLNDIKNGL